MKSNCALVHASKLRCALTENLRQLKQHNVRLRMCAHTRMHAPNVVNPFLETFDEAHGYGGVQTAKIKEIIESWKHKCEEKIFAQTKQ